MKIVMPEYKGVKLADIEGCKIYVSSDELDEVFKTIVIGAIIVAKGNEGAIVKKMSWIDERNKGFLQPVFVDNLKKELLDNKNVELVEYKGLTVNLEMKLKPAIRWANAFVLTISLAKWAEKFFSKDIPDEASLIAVWELAILFNNIFNWEIPAGLSDEYERFLCIKKCA